MAKPKIAFTCEAMYSKLLFENDLDDMFTVKMFPMKFHKPLSFYEELIQFEADYNFFFRGEFLPARLLDALPGRKINMSTEPFPKVIGEKLYATPDSIDRLNAFIGIKNHPFDFIFHYDQTSLSVLRRVGCYVSGCLPTPVATVSLRHDSPLPKVLPVVNAEFDVLFAGRSTPHREHIFGPLKHHYNFLHIESGIFGLELIPLINKSKIVLNVHVEDFLNWEPRVQQFLASGAFVMSEPLSPNEYLVAEQHFVQATTADMFLERVGYYLQHDKERLAIARAGNQRVCEVLAANKFFPTLIDDIESGRYAAPRFRIDEESMQALSYYARLPEFDFAEEYFSSFNELID